MELYELQQLPSSAKEALRINSRYYFTGKTCIRGHTAKRKTANGQCYQCSLNSTNKWKKLHPEEMALSKKEWAAKNPEKQQDSSRNWARNHPEENKKKCADWVAKFPRKHKSGRLRFGYGMTIEEYDCLFKNQDGKCEICRKIFDDNIPVLRPCVDHDHNTGKIRALLCGNCNKGLGMFNDSPQPLKQAIRYLRRHANHPSA